MSGIKGKGLSRRFGGTAVLKDMDFEFPDKGLIGILGVSGAGKSTFLNILGGLDTNYGGSLSVFGNDYRAMKEEERSSYRLREVGFLRQNSALLDLESAKDNIRLPIVSASRNGKRFVDKKCGDLLDLVGLPVRGKDKAGDLSGGERQRVALSRSLGNDPPLLLCDEPTSALDGENAARVFSVLRKRSGSALVVVVSHDEKLLFRYADWIYELKDGKLSLPAKGEGGGRAGPAPLKKKRFKDQGRAPVSFWLGHAYRLLRSKGRRSLVTLGALCLSLCGTVFSNYLGEGLSGEVSRAFSSIVGPPSVVIEKGNPDEPTLGRVISCPLERVKALVEEHPDLFCDYGISYLADFENFFPDAHEAFIPNRGGKIVVPGLSLRTANDYLYLDSGDIHGAAPELPGGLENDQVVLGLPYASMANLCYGLGISRSYGALGDYIAERGLELVYRMQNDSWAYADEQILEISAVTRTDVATIFHYSREWSTYLFEFKMRLPSSDEPDDSLPWILQKVPYVVPRREGEFLLKVREKGLGGYIFEPPSYDYEKTHCKIGERCGLNRYYVYLADERRISEREIGEALSTEGVSGLYTCTDGSYVNFPSSYMSGFLMPFYVSSSASGIDGVIDAVGQVEEEFRDYEPELPKGVYSGSYLKPAGTGITFTSDMGEFLDGGPPSSLDEIALSSELYAALGGPEAVHVGATVGELSSGGYYLRDIRKASLKVSGVFASPFMMLGHGPRWTEDFYSYVLGMSSFLLRPVKLVCLLEEGKEEETYSSLLYDFPGYRLSRPYLSMEESLSSLSSVLSSFLGMLSYAAYAFSLLLLCASSYLAAEERRREKRLLYELGISRTDIFVSGIALSIVLLSAAFLFALLSSFIVESAVHMAISRGFGSETGFVYDFGPVLSCLPFIGMAFLLTAAYEAASSRRGGNTIKCNPLWKRKRHSP